MRKVVALVGNAFLIFILLKFEVKMLKGYKTEIKPNEEQKIKIKKTIGVCRFIYNLYLSYNNLMYEKEKRFVKTTEFSKYINHEYLKQNKDKIWIKEVSTKSVKQSMIYGQKAFENFFKKKSDYPKYKKKNSENDIKMYFIKEGTHVERHRIKIPTLGWVRLKEYGYIPINGKIKSGTVSVYAGRYYVSCQIESEEVKNRCKLINEGIGIDLGIKELAVCSDGKTYHNINKERNIKKYERRLKRQQRKLSKKIKSRKEGFYSKNSSKIILKIQKLYQRLANIRKDYTNKVVSEIVKTKPSYITIEDLNIKGMLKNKHLAKAIAEQNLYYFRTILTNKCKEYGIELRIANRFYPSSKMCSKCGAIHKDLKLSDRVYKCECGNIIDRDLNASCNLKNCKDYVVG